jgi:hypothetical protein
MRCVRAVEMIARRNGMDNSDSKYPLFDDLHARGIVALAEIVEQKREESLHLEFKSLSNHDAASLTKDDRRLIAKSICGLCNAEGGLLVLGVETVRSEGVDIANALKSFSNLDGVRNRIVSALPEMLSPQHPQISVLSIPESSRSSAGFVVVHVPPSDARPHMSTVHHQYFRRGSDGTRVLEHGEVRELMFLPRQAKLALQYRMRNTIRQSYMCGFDCILSLRNEGKVSVRAPFIKAVGLGLNLASELDSAFSIRQISNEVSGVYANGGVLVHIDDELAIAKVATGLHLHEAEGYDFKFFVKKILDEKLTSKFSIRTVNESRNNATPYDRLIKSDVTFGGENAPTQSERFSLDKWEAFELMAQELLR